MKNALETIVYAGVFSIPFVVLLVADTLFFPYITGKNFAFRIIVEVIFASWIILALWDKAYRPRFSFMLASFGALLVVMFAADMFGAHPGKSFWSNFERMEGYVTLVHVGMLFLVAGSMMGHAAKHWHAVLLTSMGTLFGFLFMIETFSDFGSAALWSYPTGLVTFAAFVLFCALMVFVYRAQTTWDRLFTMTLGVAVLLSWYALAQFFGTIAISQGGTWRVDGTLGNSTYMAVYMLFHIFITALVYVRSNSPWLRSIALALGLLFVFILVQTGTRGAVIGLAGGTLLALLYIAVFARGKRMLRMCAIGSCAAAVIAGVLFVAFRDSAFIQNDERLARIADISLEEGKTRFTIWSVALEGVKERPILGWGQSNFDYVFNKYYKPSLYAQETWFDRVHNIVLDWLIAGGVLGALCYFGIFAAALWYLLIIPLRKNGEISFDVVERGILVGLLGGYVCHNLFVFDNVISYIFFAFILAYMHSSVAVPIGRIEKAEVEPHTVLHVHAPIVGVIAAALIYVVNVPALMAGGDLIQALSTQSPKEKLALFERALSHDSFGNQEIREQMMQQSTAVLSSPAHARELKQEWFTKTESALRTQTEERPGDARGLQLFGVFYRLTNNLDAAAAELAAARAVSPQKQQIIFEQGMTALQGKNYEEALRFFREAYELAPEYGLARVFYAAASIYDGEMSRVQELINTEAYRTEFLRSDIVLSAFYETKQYAQVENVLQERIAARPADIRPRTNLAALYVEEGRKSEALDVLHAAIKDIPSFEAEGKRFIAEIEKSD